MIQRFNTRPPSQSWVRRLTALSVISLASVSLLGASGCDTVATISFSERGFRNVYPVGVAAPGGQCAGIDGDLAMRFVMVANDETPITNDPQELVGGSVVNMNAQAIKMGAGHVYSTPDVMCEANSCEETNFVCPSSDTSLASRCQRSTTVALKGAPKFLSDTDKNHLFGVLAENSGSLRGWLPSDLGGYYPVKVGEEAAQNTINGQPDPGPIPARASDNNKRRSSAVAGLIGSFNNVSAYARGSGRTALFGLWTFAESSAQVLSKVSSEGAPDQLWASQPTTIKAAQDRYSQEDTSSTRANVYEATLKVLNEGYADPQYSDYAKTLVLFVDGPDDFRRGSASDSTPESVTQRATELGVRLFIVHLDPRLTKADTLRDDPRYYEQQAEPCASDDACKNFEECRYPQTFTSSPSNASVLSAPPNYENANPKQYCLPKRDELGRIGPIADYAQMACATSGGYIYVPSAGGLRPQMEWLPFTMDGLWEVTVELPDSRDGTLTAGNEYRLETTMTVTLADESKTVDYSRLGLAVTGDEDARDSRPAFFVKP